MKRFQWIFSIWASVCVGGAAHAAVPAQFIAKLYTEALGRAPDPVGWAERVKYFSDNPCNTSTLSFHAKSILESGEFEGGGYSNSAKLLLLYRTVLDREPDSAGFRQYLGQLDGGASVSEVASAFLQSSEFTKLVPLICSGDSYSFNALGAGGYAIDLPGVPVVNQAILQGMLNEAGPGGAVALPSMALVTINSTLMIPAGVTLTTAGNPLPASHGKMARLVRGANYTGGQAMIKLAAGGARLTHIWVDGQRGAAPAVEGVSRPFGHDDINIQSLSGAKNEVSSNFIANTAGWSSLQMVGIAETGIACEGNTIKGNVITAYSSSNSDIAGKSWADGISDSCEDSIVTNNQIVDATDGAIVLFRAQINGVGAVQRSQVTENVILNAGNHAYVGIAVDPLYVTGGCRVGPSFAGSYVGRNALWTGPNAIIEIGLAVGTSEWFFSNGGCLGTGANVSDNTSSGFKIRANDGVAIQGMLNATVQANDLRFIRARKGQCRSHSVSAGVLAGIASGKIQRFKNVALKDCI